MAFTATIAIGSAGKKHALFFPSYEGQLWVESDLWAESAPWLGPPLLTHTSFVGLVGTKSAYSPAPFAHTAGLVAGFIADGGYLYVVYGAAIFTGGVSFNASGAKNAFGGAEIGYTAGIEADGLAAAAPLQGHAFFAHSHMLGFGGRKIFSFAQIQEADVATITQGGRVPVRFVQGESVERNTFYFMPDGVTPIADLSTYKARMDLREYPDDPTALLSMSSEDGSIFLSDTGLIVWEIPGSVTKDFNAITFGGDLFVHAPDGDAIMVCGFDFEMTISHTRGV